MLRIPRPVVAAALGAVLLSGLSACGDAKEPQGDALTEISLVFENALTVCGDLPNAPFAYSVNGQATGFDVEITAAIADELGLSLDYIDVPVGDIASGAALNAGTCDLGASALAITGSRARVVDFSSPYFDNQYALVMRKTAEARTLPALAKQRVGVRSGSTAGVHLREEAPDVTVVEFPDAQSLERALARGGVAAVLLDSGVAEDVVKRRKNMVVAESVKTGEQFGLAVKKDGNLPLLRRVNGILADMVENGTYDEIYKKYF